MADASPHPAPGRSPARKLLALGGFALLGAAVVKELRMPPKKRKWTGRLGPFPYDLRPPTLDRVRERCWNPKGPLLSPHVFGVGWTINFGRLVSLVKDR
jgi:Family of unknown function (DUF5808)